MAAPFTWAVAINSGAAVAGARAFSAAMTTMRAPLAAGQAAVSALNTGLNSFKGIMGAAVAAAAAFSIKSVVQASDDFSLLQARLRLFTGSASEAALVFDAIREAAERSRSTVGDFANIFNRNSFAMKQMGRSSAEAIRFTETLAKAIQVSGVGANEAAAAMYQLSQAVSSGRFQGDEFRSVAENLPYVLRILQEETGKTALQLRQLAADGQLSAKVLVNSLLNASQRVDDQFKQMPATAGRAFTQLTDAFKISMGQLAETSGVSKAWSDLFDHMREAVASPAFQDALAGVATGVRGIAYAIRALMDLVREVDITMRAWYAALADTTVFKVFAAAVDLAKNGLSAFWDISKEAVSVATAAVTPQAFIDIAKEAEKARANIEQLRRWQDLVITNDKKIEVKAPSTKLPVDLGMTKIEEEIRLQRLKNELVIAEAEGERTIIFALQEQISYHTRITEELKRDQPEMARRLELEVRMGEQVKRTGEIIQRNRELGENMAKTLFQGFRDAAQEGQSFGRAMASVALKMVDLITQTLILEPIVKNIGKAFASWMGGTDTNDFLKILLGGIKGGLGGGSGGGWETTVLPAGANFAGAGIGSASIALPRAPRSAPIAERSAAPMVNITITGDATDETVRKMEAVASRVFDRNAPGVVQRSVAAVRREHRADASYLRR